MEYTVTQNGTSVGTVFVQRDGLYMEIHCQCQRQDREVHRLILVSGDQERNLGVLLPEGNTLKCTKKIPLRQWQEGEIEFVLDKKGGCLERFLPVSETEVFPEPEALPMGQFALRSGVPGILVPLTSPATAPPGSGQSRESPDKSAFL